MPPKQKSRKKHKGVYRPPPINPVKFMTDEECVEQRRLSAEKEMAKVRVVDLVDGFRGTHEVESTQWSDPYVVEIRALEGLGNTCSCMDFQMNRLGTCKHIERVMEVIPKGKKRLFNQAKRLPSPMDEVFVDARGEAPRLRWLRTGNPPPSVAKALDPYFDSEGVGLGPVPETVAAVRRAVDALSRVQRKQVRFSSHIDAWVEREALRAELDALRRGYESDVAAGKQTDNPVNLPLYPYQKLGMEHLAFRGRAMLADEMGLGKTVQAIAAAELLMKLGKVRRVLVVCPASLKGEWEDQLHQFTGREARLLFGNRAQRLHAYGEDIPWLVANYEQVRNDVEEINRCFAPDLVILDEAQRIKNWPTKTAKTIKRLESRFAFVLTGTPLENRAEELYSLVEFVDPRLFGSIDRFYRDHMMWDGEKLRPQNTVELHRALAPVMLRRRKSDVEDNLPARSEKTFFVEMTDEQALRYAEYEERVAKLLMILKRRKLTKEELDKLQMWLACMRMICDTPYILDRTCRDCPKLVELSDVLDDVLDDPETKVILFSEWVSMLELVKELLEKKGVGFTEHHGTIPQKKRRENIREFKTEPGCRVFLSSESGGTGLNLQNANIVINMDLPWNPAKLEQRIARAWRKKQKRGVQVLNFVTSDSIEEKMIGKLAYKAELADAVLDGKAFAPVTGGGTAREEFLKRIGDLLGRGAGRDEPAAIAKPPRELEEELCGRFERQLLGIERLKESGATLVVALPGSDTKEIERVASTHADAPVAVITPETKELLLRLQEMGILTLREGLETKHAKEGYASLAQAVPAPPPPPRYPDKAKAHWEKAEQEFQAAQALISLGLTSPAEPHLRAVLTRAKETLAVFHTGESDGKLPAGTEHAHLWKNLNAKLSNPPRELEEMGVSLDLCKSVREMSW